MIVEQEVSLPNDSQNVNIKQKVNSGQTSQTPSVAQSVSQNVEESDKINAEHKWELERQLHEQYASNSNSHIKSFITFSTALFALFGFYGYLYAHTTDEFSRRVVQIILPSGNADVSVGVSPLYSLQSFILLALIVVVIFCFLTSLCVFLGYAERRDQIQIGLIRKNNGLQKTVYSDPTKRGYRYYLASYYRFFYNILLLSQVFVIASAAIKCPPQCSTFVLFIYFLMAAFLAVSVRTKVKYYINYKRVDIFSRRETNPEKWEFKDEKLYKKNYVFISNGNKLECYNKSEVSLENKEQKVEEMCGFDETNWFQYCWSYKSHSFKHKCVRVLFRFAFDIIVFAIAICIPLLAGAVTL